MQRCLALFSWVLIVAASPAAHRQDAAQVQRDLIDAQVARFFGPAADSGRVFFLGFAGYGEERVFAEEIKLAAQRVGEKYGSATRSRAAAQRPARSRYLSVRLGFVFALRAQALAQ